MNTSIHSGYRNIYYRKANVTTHAVITGDVVNSRDISDRIDLMEVLESTMHHCLKKFSAKFEIYRGDSFQLDIPNHQEGVIAAILIRSAIIARSPSKRDIWDVRLSIGIGAREYTALRVSSSSGQAYELSGEGMDEISKKKERLIIKTPSHRIDNELDLITRFADDIICNWSHYSAEVVFWALYETDSQNEIAKLIERSQPTVHARLRTAKYKLLNAYIHRANEIIRIL